VTVTLDASAAGDRLDRALATALAAEPGEPPPSRTRLKALIAEGAVSSGGATISDPSQRVKPGQKFTIAIPEPTPLDVAAQKIPLSIVYEDEDLLVIDKPAGLVVHPGPGNPDRTLVNALLAHCSGQLSGIGGVARPGIVHRLDKDTSGLLVAAKSDAAHQGLAAQFAKHTVERVYAALVWGAPRPLNGEISGAIGRSHGDRKKMAVVAAGHGKEALTRYRTVKLLAGGEIAWIECRLATGRTHQIRVHLAAAGHPLVGDPVYGRGTRRRTVSAKVAALATPFERQALDAYIIGFEHPIRREHLRFEKKLASDINQLIDKLESK
jgi:23S rRNA pseudouridine1911/1915/1917 synthase